MNSGDQYTSEAPGTDNEISAYRRMPLSVHEARVVNSCVRVGPGRYRVTSPPPFVQELSRTGGVKPTEDDQMVGRMPFSSLTRIVEMLPPPRLKRPHYKVANDDIILDSGRMAGPEGKKAANFKTYNNPYKKFHVNVPTTSRSNEEGDVLSYVDGGDVVTELSPDLHDVSVAVGVDKDSVHLEDRHEEEVTEVEHQYVEEVVDVIDEEQGYMHSFNRDAGVSRIHSLGLGNVSIVKQLRGENNYLKEQLEASLYRIRQLEALLADKNIRIKQLVAETVQQNVNIRRLSVEIGEDAAAEILNRKHSCSNSNSTRFRDGR